MRTRRSVSIRNCGDSCIRYAIARLSPTRAHAIAFCDVPQNYAESPIARPRRTTHSQSSKAPNMKASRCVAPSPSYRPRHRPEFFRYTSGARGATKGPVGPHSTRRGGKTLKKRRCLRSENRPKVGHSLKQIHAKMSRYRPTQITLSPRKVRSPIRVHLFPFSRSSGRNYDLSAPFMPRVFN